jgi:mono/diheme cytochrome c family protein
MTRLILYLTIAIAAITIAAFSQFQKPAKWIVPEQYEKMKNPVEADAVSLQEGKAIYKRHCVSCHGKTGKGDGVKAAQLDVHPGNFAKDLKEQTDGALFYKTAEGRNQMPSYKKKLQDDEIWSVVNYIRTLK